MVPAPTTLSISIFFVMQGDQGIHDRQAKPGAFLAFMGVLTAPVEGQKDVGQHVFGNAAPGIGNRDQKGVTGCGKIDIDASAFGREFHRVGE